MDRRELLNALNAVRDGAMTPEDAVGLLDRAPFEDIGFAKIDHHRQLRNGAAEVIYGAGKTAEQIAAIAGRMVAAGGKNILITRMDADKAAIVEKASCRCSTTPFRGWASSTGRNSPWRAGWWWPPAAPATCPWRRRPP